MNDMVPFTLKLCSAIHRALTYLRMSSGNECPHTRARKLCGFVLYNEHGFLKVIFNFPRGFKLVLNKANTK